MMTRPHLSVVAPAPQSSTPSDRRLQQRATLLYPQSNYLQREWLRAVSVVRSTRNGWHLDRPVERKQ